MLRIIELLHKLLGKRRKQMAKKDDASRAAQVKFERMGDGLTPSTAPWGFIGKAPLGTAVPPSGSALIRLGVKFDMPMLAFQPNGSPDITPTKQIFGPDEEIQVVVKNPSIHASMMVEAGESVVWLHPLTFGGL